MEQPGIEPISSCGCKPLALSELVDYVTASVPVMSRSMWYSELQQQNNDLMATDYGLFPMGASFDQSSSGAGVPASGWSTNQQRVPPAVSTLRRSQHGAIGSPRSDFYYDHL